MRIACAGIMHETSTFASGRTTLADFENGRGVFRGQEIVDRYRGTNVCTGGFIDGAETEGFELVPLLRAGTYPSGLIVLSDYEAMKGEIIDRLRTADAEQRIDGVLLDQHGSMVVEEIDDADGDLIAAVREYLGPDRPIVVTTDLHANQTLRRTAAADSIVGFDTYPHVDMQERGREAANIIARTVRGEISLAMEIRQLPLLWGCRVQITALPPMDEVLERLHELEQRPGIVCATISTSFPWADVPEVGSSVLVTADGDAELARATADEFGDWIWENRERWHTPPLSVRDALAEGEQIGKYPIILADHADNPGGGSPGDSTEILQTFFDMNLQDALLLQIIDPEVAQAAHQAGVGGTLDMQVGGKSDPVQGPPVDGPFQVTALAEGKFSYDGPMFAGLDGDMGPSACLKKDGVLIVVVSGRDQPFDPAFARTLGIDCEKMRYIGIKSAVHFRAAFGPFAGSIHNVDASAIQTHDFAQLPYQKRTRPVFPVEIGLEE